MSARHRFGTLAAAFTLLFVIVTSTHATTVTGGSKYGTACSSEQITAISTGDSADVTNCETSTPTTFTIDGQPYNGDIFYYADTSTSPVEFVDYGVFDVIDTGATNFALSVVNTSLPTGILTCGTALDPTSGSSANSAVDSEGGSLTLACMAGTSAAGVTQTPTSTGFTFTSSDGDLVVYTVAGNIAEVTPTPEPGSLMLLGIGLFALAGLAFKAR
jgi:hypothetical protein